MRAAGERADGARLRALIVALWLAGLRISEALALAETDMDPRPGAVLVRRGKGNKRREVGMDTWGWEQLRHWENLRTQLPVGACFSVIHGPTAGRNWEPSSARRQLRRNAAAAGVRRRFAPHQLRHAHAVEMAHEGVPLVVMERLANLGVPRSISKELTTPRSSTRSLPTPASDPRRRRSPHDAVTPGSPYQRRGPLFRQGSSRARV
jgi:site-specific recombinase XerD